MTARRLRALLIAPPGAGKGTQAKAIAAHFGVPHISTGDVFRREVDAGTDLGKEVSGYLVRGDLVPDPIVGDIVWRAVQEAVAETGGYLLDGFPRTRAQAEVAYEVAKERGLTADAVVTFDVRREVLMGRLLHRGEGRPDDDETTIRHRLDVYDAQTAPVLEYYVGRGILVRVDADRPIEDVTAAAIAALEGRAP